MRAYNPFDDVRIIDWFIGGAVVIFLELIAYILCIVLMRGF